MSKSEGCLSTGGFYGKKNKRKWIGLENSINSVVKKHQKEKIPKSFPSRTCMCLHLRVKALRETQDRDVSFCKLSRLLHYYSQLDDDKRLHYEVIPEGAVCKLYFDLEYDKTVNPGCDGNHMVDIFIQYVCKALQATFRVTCTRKDVLDLQASTERKFSRHLIFQMKKAVFKDNIHAGRFVCSIMSRLVEKIYTAYNTGTDSRSVHHTAQVTKEREYVRVEKDIHDQTIDEDKCRLEEKVDKLKEVIESFAMEDLHSLMVKNKNGEDIPFCDTGVYTKNRNFRLFLASKLGKKNPLVVAAQNEFYSKGDSQQSKLENIFYDSLVANVEYCDSMRILSFDGENLSGHMIGLPGRKREKTSKEAECIDGYSKSPYPEVDEYISNIITKDSGKGVIRHWTYFHQGELLVYEIAKYRYCHNIGRHHRSNNIMLVVDLHKGVWYQKCHDPDCHMQNYKSPEWPLPRNLLPASYFEDDLDLEMDDDELLNTTAELEKQYMEQQADCSGVSELDDGADDELIAAVTNLDSNTFGNVENG